ncbi:MAG: phenylalanine--tRNA ligase subunit beta [Deltaproteobacteria bacterium]|nr:phenylalanine--tRNA ligase subunit beta [Deltaproteobacteria bacterium]
MKLHLSILDKLIELPTKDPLELRPLLDDLGYEVKGIEGSGLQTIFTVESQANRGDQLYALGAARDLSARLLTPISMPQMAAELSDKKASIPVRVATDKCLRYALLEMTLPKPMELRSDIEAVMQSADSGAVRKHAMVDILNYILLELGQPMHAFDREKVEGEISIELTDKVETIEALDDKTYQVPVGSIVIKDRKKIIAVAGVIGCKNSMMTLDSSAVLVESAAFDPVSVRITARAMGISTDASYAFERGSDREAVIAGLKRMVALAQGAGGSAKNSCHVLGLTDIGGAATEKTKIPLRLATLRKQMNLARLADVEVATRLKNLGFACEALPTDKNGAAEWKVTVPSWRAWDVKTEEDLIEEFVRAHGLNKVKLELPPLDYESAPETPADEMLRRVEGALVGNGFIEVITKIFSNAEDVALLESLRAGIAAKHLTIKNAVERSYSHLKLTNILHHARLSAENHRRGVLSFKVFEFGRLFELGMDGGQFEFEHDVLTLSASGRWTEHEWQKPESTEELLFLFKGVVENVVRALGITDLVTADTKEAFLHPGCQAQLRVGRDVIGIVGLIHPLLREKLGLRHDFVYAELDAAKLIKNMTNTKLIAPSDFPVVRRDITLKIPAMAQAGKILKLVRDEKLDNLVEVAVVDNFKKQEEDFRRVTYRLTFQSATRTLESAEVDDAMEKVVSMLKTGHSIERA